jgi:hypothetical protein
VARNGRPADDLLAPRFAGRVVDLDAIDPLAVSVKLVVSTTSASPAHRSAQHPRDWDRP